MVHRHLRDQQVEERLAETRRVSEALISSGKCEPQVPLLTLRVSFSTGCDASTQPQCRAISAEAAEQLGPAQWRRLLQD
jgi:hypothetical protein